MNETHLSHRLLLRNLAAAIWFCGFFVSVGNADDQTAKLDFFESKIRPILIEHCYECHSTKSGEASGELKLDTAESLRKGGSRGSVISDQSPHESLLLKAVSYEVNDMQMPPAGKLPQEAIDSLRIWIEQGAVDPRASVEESKTGPSREELASKHWSFLPVPAVVDPPLSIDQMLQKGWNEKGLVPNPLASKREVIRRLYYDLLGLPPTLEEIEKLEANSDPNYETLVDGLLASPHFGERMARRWMDVARYADNKGYVFQEDREYAHAWRYREWLIQSFNNDMPYDQFASFQLAADRLDPGPENKNLDAMGFLTLGRRFLNNENDIADDRIDLITRGFLGLSVACARCHDHKFDPISMADYYSLHATLVSNKEPKDEPGPLRMVDAENLRSAIIFKRGNPGQRGAKVPKEFIKFIASVSRPLETGSGRLDLAQSIADKNNPLTSRVLVNRVWGWFMGVPLVDTPSDFGLRSEPPVQRELLDQLAASFLADGQKIKGLVRRIVLSDAYRRSSVVDSNKQMVDPENRYWWRGVRKRLDFESLRDHTLVALGQLDRTLGGQSIKMMDPPFSNRRTVYAYIDRQNLQGVFRSFDFASPDSHSPMRFSTTVPQQGLFLMNSHLIDHYCMEFANRILANEQLQDNQKRIEAAFRSVMLRSPSESEHAAIVRYVEQLGISPQVAPTPEQLGDLVKAFLCSNEFCFID